ncbi:hypothetical protein GCM10027199_02880 [Amycolatopsis magusensis]
MRLCAFSVAGGTGSRRGREAVGRVREAVRDVMRGCREAVVVDAVLLADELVTDVLRAGSGLRGVWLTRENDQGQLSIEVDYLTDAASTASRPDEEAWVGRWLLERLAGVWGVRATGPVHTTWARLRW